MESELKRKKVHNRENIPEHRFRELELFSRKVVKKYGIIIFSTLVSRDSGAGTSAGMTLVIDDINNVVFDKQVADLKMDVAEMAYASPLPLKCDIILASDLWRGFQARDNDVLDLMRSSLVIHDGGFFLPLQDLLVTGKVRPSKESVEVYFVKAERSMKNSNQKVAKAVIDLYWAVTDAAHAAVMVAGVIPPSPDHLADAVKNELVARNLVHKRCADIVDRIHAAAKKIMHREFFEISGRDFDSYLADADFFIKEIDEFVRDHVKD